MINGPSNKANIYTKQKWYTFTKYVSTSVVYFIDLIIKRRLTNLSYYFLKSTKAKLKYFVNFVEQNGNVYVAMQKSQILIMLLICLCFYLHFDKDILMNYNICDLLM